MGALSLTGTLSNQVNKVALVGALEIECGLRLWRKFNQFNGLLEMERERYGARTPDVISETPPSAFIAYYCGLRLPRPPVYTHIIWILTFNFMALCHPFSNNKRHCQNYFQQLLWPFAWKIQRSPLTAPKSQRQKFSAQLYTGNCNMCGLSVM